MLLNLNLNRIQKFREINFKKSSTFFKSTIGLGSCKERPIGKVQEIYDWSILAFAYTDGLDGYLLVDFWENLWR